MVYLLWFSCVSLEIRDHKIMTSSPVNDNIVEEITLGKTIDLIISTSYCQTKDCKTISCSSASDSGKVVSEFIETDFKANCKNTESIKLSFSHCKFTENTLQRNWLSTNLSIVELTFDSCSLSEIEDEVFSLAIFEKTQKILFEKNKISSLRRAMFHRLDSLGDLSIRENTILQAEYNLLENVAGTLTNLELSHAINDPKVLRNITGGNRATRVQILTLRGNSIPTISSELFVGVPKVQALYLEDSKIKTVSQGALEPMATVIQQLIMTGNSISSLPEGLFNSVLHPQRSFRMAIDSNPWHCDCNLKWLQDLVKTDPDRVYSIPVCKTPEANAGMSFVKADFCPPNSTVTDIVSTVSIQEPTRHDWNQTTTQSSATTEKDIELTCSVPRSLLEGRNSQILSSDFRFPSRSPNFYVSKIKDDSILVNLPDLDEGAALLWFDNNDVEHSLSCAKNVKGSYLVRNIDPQASYTICLLSDNQSTVSPLNCLAATTDPDYQYQTWLRNADKIVAFVLIIATFVLLFLVGGFIAFLLIRRHPTLLRGSKRVMLVKRRNLDAIILPKGVTVGEERCKEEASTGSKTQEDGYITPLPPTPVPAPRGRRVSRNSLQSYWNNSYMSELEPVESQWTSWRLSRSNNEMEKRKSEAPPLPPHHPTRIPSLSLTVDLKNEYSVDRASIV
ncbi:uncharacterized protein LOC143183141 [Calliopsis andreniformis]|uniref:uncharacterized protein LOC143183141 n=1 Tax=Calliopsis andreniformis TaxID=337506 RepID=UPI003FCDFDC8